MRTTLCFLFLTCVVTSGLATPQDGAFRTMVLEELQTMKAEQQTMKTKNVELEQKFAELEQKYAVLESDNKHLSEKVSQGQGSTIRRQLGYVPEQEIAFSASVSQHMKNLTAHQPIVFGTTLTNNGGFYNATSGVFYVPVAGTYLLFVNVLSELGNSIETELVANGNVISEIYSGGSHQFFGAGSNLVIVHLKQGTNLWVKVHAAYSTDMSVHCCWSTFSGYLLRENDDMEPILG